MCALVARYVAYKRSAYAMLVTSLTTGVAFIQLYFQSDLLGIRAFGFCTARHLSDRYRPFDHMSY